MSITSQGKWARSIGCELFYFHKHLIFNDIRPNGGQNLAHKNYRIAESQKKFCFALRLKTQLLIEARNSFRAFFVLGGSQEMRIEKTPEVGPSEEIDPASLMEGLRRHRQQILPSVQTCKTGSSIFPVRL